MVIKDKQLGWKALGKSVQGASHVRNNKVCQDAIRWKKINKSIIFAIADGHGSSRSPYSDEGSQVAVQVAVETLEKLYKNLDLKKNLSNIKHFSEEQLKKLIVRNWRGKVEKAYEVRKLKEGITEDTDNFYVKYGSTLIAILATPDFILFLQLGDGDIIVAFQDGEISYAIEKDEELVGIETTSLCSKDGWKYIKTSVYKLNSNKNALEMIMLSTDGFYNSFTDDAGYKKNAEDYLKLLKKHGVKKIENNLEKWLSETSKEGCGDDITLGIICS
ncbi:MAG: protein phosphatase 2C domain-containing protein, partial [Clostridiaceae bacterium]|nr:protein phosphatase 2C domain-containing protein [Clostridiaceae bacterium]